MGSGTCTRTESGSGIRIHKHESKTVVSGRTRGVFVFDTVPTLMKHTASSPGCNLKSCRMWGDAIALPLERPLPKAMPNSGTGAALALSASQPSAGCAIGIA